MPANIEFLNLAKIKKLLDEWFDEHYQDERRREVHERKRLPEPPKDEAAAERVSSGFQQLSERLKLGLAP